MAAKETGSLVLTDDVAADGSIGMNSVYRATLSVHIQPDDTNMRWQNFTIQMDNDTKHTVYIEAQI